MNAQQKKLLLPIAILALGLVSLIGAAFFILRDTGSKSPAAAVGGPFSMIDHHGARVSEASYRGGPMMYGDIVGLSHVVAAMDKYRARYGDLYWTPAPLLAKLAASGQTFAQWSASRG